jgi:hypothetical protein
MPRVKIGYSQAEDSLFRDMNVLMQQYDRAGVRMPQEIRKYRERIADIYQENNIRGQFAKNDIFPRGAAIDKLNPGIRDELRSIAEGMMDNDYVYNLHDYENYLDILKDKKFEKWDVTSVNDVIDRLDFLKNTMDSEVIKNILSSDQLMDLYDTAKNNNISEDDLLRQIVEQYDATGYMGDTLHESIYQAIEHTGKEEKAARHVKFGSQGFSEESADHVNDIRLPKSPKLSGRRKTKKKR